MATSSIRPKNIEFLYEKDGKSYYRLCKNIVEKVWTADFTGEKKTEYVYDMYDLEMTTVNGLDTDINNKFDLYWELAKKQTEEKELFNKKMIKYRELQKNGEMADMLLMVCDQVTELIINM